MAAVGPVEPDGIIDACAVVYDRDCWEVYLRLLGRTGPRYLSTFARPLCRQAGVALAQYQEGLARSPDHAVDVLLSGEGLDTDIAGHVATGSAGGVVHEVWHGCPGRIDDGTTVTDRLIELAAPFGSRVSVWGGLDLSDPDAAVDELDRLAKSMGLVGATMAHWWGGPEPLDPASHRVYAAAEARGIALWIHTGMNFATPSPADLCSWRTIDAIACEHPDLRIVVGHAGWPDLLYGMAVVQRHSHVYAELSAHRPKHMGTAGNGWEPLLSLGGGVACDKILFGSVSWVHQRSVAALADELRALPISPAAAQAWLHDNAARLLGVEPVL